MESEVVFCTGDQMPHVSAKENLQVPQSPLEHPADQDELDKGPQTVANQHNNGDDVTTIWTSFRTLLQKAMDRSIPSNKRQQQQTNKQKG